MYLGPVSPHWEVYGDWGDRQTLDEFRARSPRPVGVVAAEDPQFRRNRERIVRDAEREMISIEWDLGVVMQQAAAAEPDTASDEASEPEPATEVDAAAERQPAAETSETPNDE